MKTIEALQAKLTDELTPIELAQVRHLRNALNGIGLHQSHRLLERLATLGGDSIELVNAVVMKF